jgi:hypothetical protein
MRLHCINTLDASFMQLLCCSQLEDTFTLCKFVGLGNTLRLRSIVTHGSLFMQLLCHKQLQIPFTLCKFVGLENTLVGRVDCGLG